MVGMNRVVCCVQAAATRDSCEDKIHSISDKLREVSFTNVRTTFFSYT